MDRHDSSGTGHRDTRHWLGGGQALSVRMLLLLIAALALAGCSTKPENAATSAAGRVSTATAVSGAAPQSPATAASAPASTAATVAIATAIPTPKPLATAAAVTTPVPLATSPAAPPAATVDALKGVIQRANQEQQEAYARHEPTLMRDTATPAYYIQLVEGLRQLEASGATAIRLIDLQWGTITLQGPAAAQVTTSETWETTLNSGGTQKETDTNVYSLVQRSDGWKIAEDEHPDTRVLQPLPGTPGTAPTPPAPGGTAGAGSSRNWAGYNALGGTFTAVSGTWVVPTVGTGASPAADAIWVGIGGVTAHDLIQAGTSATVESGQVSYSAWIETLPQASEPISLPVKAGDSISVAITQQPDGTWQILIHNGTSGQTFQTRVNYRSSRSSAEWVAESPAVGRRLLLPLDDFGTITFTGSTTIENGQQRTIAQAGGTPITMINLRGQQLAGTSPLGADGESFTVTRSATPAASVAPATGAVPAITTS